MSGTQTLQVTRKAPVADGVVEITLRDPAGERLPDWAPGSHVAVHLGNGLVRPYSLCGDRWASSEFVIAVRREPQGSGGSAYIHDELSVGDLVGVGQPRCAFPLVPSDSLMFVAGGIGISPLVPMMQAASQLGTPFRLLFLGRDWPSMPYANRLLDEYGPDLIDLRTTKDGRPDLGALIGSHPGDRPQARRVYACGPPSLHEHLYQLSTAWPPRTLWTEPFQRPALATDAAFTVNLARSGRTITVPRDLSVLDVLHRSGVDVLSSCRVGSCGACETPVLAGGVDHRDAILDADNEGVMYPCVSRARGNLLVLDI